MSNSRDHQGASTTNMFHSLTDNNPETKDIKKELLTYCHDVDNALDSRSGNVAKYLKVSPTHPDIEAADSKTRKTFLNDVNGETPAFDKFYLKLVTALDKLNPSDIESIGTNTPTETAQAFLACINQLHQAGFYNVNGKPINFWSGDEAQEKANTTLTSLSDSNVPATSIIIKLGNIFKEHAKILHQQGNKRDADIDDARANKIFAAGSAAFTMQAVGKVEVFMSAYNAQELPSLPAGNYHWMNERDTLEKLKHEGSVTSVEVSFLDRTHEKWKDPVDLNDPTIRILHKSRSDIPENKEERDKWVKEGKPRHPGVSIKKLSEYSRILLSHWKDVAHARAEAKKQPPIKPIEKEPVALESDSILKQHRRNLSEGQALQEKPDAGVSKQHKRGLSGS